MSWGVALRNAVGLGLGGIPSVLNAPPYASLNLNFLTGALDSRITFTRASGATYFNSAGVLSTAANNEARFDYDPATLAARGLLIEEQRTNSIRNNTMQGAVAGTPGTAPTNWVVPGAINGLTQEIVGIGAENGVTYIDVKFSGTTSAASNHAISFEAANQIAASSGQTWARSAWFKIVAGSTANLTALNFNLQGRDAANTVFTETFSIDIAPSLTSTFTRIAATDTLANVNTAFARSQISYAYNSGVAVNITLRIGLPQLELGAFATSVIPTTTTALTRAADVASMTGANFSDWYNQVEGTLVAEFGPYGNGGPSKNFGVVDINDGTSANIIRLFAGSTVSPVFAVTVGTVTQAYISSGTITPTNISKIASSYKADNFARSVNGAVAATASSGTVPAVNRMLIGAGQIGVGELNGHLRSFSYYPKQLSASQLQSLTKLPWTPSYITTALWLDAAEAGTITLNGSTVSQWKDKSGNARNVSQTTASAQPTYTSNGLNSLPVVTCVRSTDVLTGSLGTAGTTYSVLVVAKPRITTSTLGGPFGIYQPSGDNFNSLVYGEHTARRWHNGSNSFARTPNLVSSVTEADPPDAIILGMSVLPTQQTLFRNGTQVASATYTWNNISPANVIIGPRIFGYGYYDGLVAEIVLVQSALSTDDRQKLEGYLAWKWGLQANLPAGHPYKDAPPTV